MDWSPPHTALDLYHSKQVVLWFQVQISLKQQFPVITVLHASWRYF